MSVLMRLHLEREKEMSEVFAKHGTDARHVRWPAVETVPQVPSRLFSALDGRVGRRFSALGAEREHDVLCQSCCKVATWNISAWCDRCLDALSLDAIKVAS